MENFKSKFKPGQYVIVNTSIDDEWNGKWGWVKEITLSGRYLLYMVEFNIIMGSFLEDELQEYYPFVYLWRKFINGKL